MKTIALLAGLLLFLAIFAGIASAETPEAALAAAEKAVTAAQQKYNVSHTTAVQKEPEAAQALRDSLKVELEAASSATGTAGEAAVEAADDAAAASKAKADERLAKIQEKYGKLIEKAKADIAKIEAELAGDAPINLEKAGKLADRKAALAGKIKEWEAKMAAGPGRISKVWGWVEERASAVLQWFVKSKGGAEVAVEAVTVPGKWSRIAGVVGKLKPAWTGLKILGDPLMYVNKLVLFASKNGVKDLTLGGVEAVGGKSLTAALAAVSVIYTAGKLFYLHYWYEYGHPTRMPTVSLWHEEDPLNPGVEKCEGACNHFTMNYQIDAAEQYNVRGFAGYLQDERKTMSVAQKASDYVLGGAAILVQDIIEFMGRRYAEATTNELLMQDEESTACKIAIYKVSETEDDPTYGLPKREEYVTLIPLPQAICKKVSGGGEGQPIALIVKKDGEEAFNLEPGKYELVLFVSFDRYLISTISPAVDEIRENRQFEHLQHSLDYSLFPDYLKQEIDARIANELKSDSKAEEVAATPTPSPEAPSTSPTPTPEPTTTPTPTPIPTPPLSVEPTPEELYEFPVEKNKEILAAMTVLGFPSFSSYVIIPESAEDTAKACQPTITKVVLANNENNFAEAETFINPQKIPFEKLKKAIEDKNAGSEKSLHVSFKLADEQNCRGITQRKLALSYKFQLEDGSWITEKDYAILGKDSYSPGKNGTGLEKEFYIKLDDSTRDVEGKRFAENERIGVTLPWIIEKKPQDLSLDLIISANGVDSNTSVPVRAAPDCAPTITQVNGVEDFSSPVPIDLTKELEITFKPSENPDCPENLKFGVMIVAGKTSDTLTSFFAFKTEENDNLFNFQSKPALALISIPKNLKYAPKPETLGQALFYSPEPGVSERNSETLQEFLGKAEESQFLVVNASNGESWDESNLVPVEFTEGSQCGAGEEPAQPPEEPQQPPAETPAAAPPAPPCPTEQALTTNNTCASPPAQPPSLQACYLPVGPEDGVLAAVSKVNLNIIKQLAELLGKTAK